MREVARDQDGNLRITDNKGRGLKLCFDPPSIVFNSGDHPLDALALDIDDQLAHEIAMWANQVNDELNT